MQKQAAIQFIERLFKEVWSQPNPAKIDEFYQQDVTGYFGDQKITLADIKNRANVAQQLYSHIQTEILDMVVEDNKIALRLKQTSAKKDGTDPLVLNLLSIYHVHDNKVTKVWFLVDKPFDYKEKA